MLLALSLKDFVIVQQLNLNFQPGFTVLTGETGAGKSITLDALSLLLGDKADYSQVRSGASEAQLSALFDLSQLPELQQQLREQGLLDADSVELSIRRIIDAKGKSRSFINNQAATLSQLKNMGSQLIDIHGQNAHHSLNQESAQRQLLDAFSGSLKLLEDTKTAYQAWQNSLQALKDAQTQSEAIALERERLEWQLNELGQLDLQEGEWETLNESFDRLSHAAELLQAAEETQTYIDGEDGLQHFVYRCQRTLQPLSQIEPKFAECLQLLESVEAELSEVSHQISRVMNRVEINPNELAVQEERMRDIMSIARKYRLQPNELPEKRHQLQTALMDLDAAADIETLEQTVQENKQNYFALAQKLSIKRQEAAQKLSQETTRYMQQLAMKDAQFHIELLPANPSCYGLEQVQYQVSANKGTPLRPLNKVASGGELARISLSLQVVTSQYTALPTLIFDEVDSGIGGGVAEIVGKALRTLGAQHQVLAVTHLPQVAACGEHHWQVTKQHQNEQTISNIHILNHQERVDEIARMLGGETITEITKKHAKEMLDMAQNAV